MKATLMLYLALALLMGAAPPPVTAPPESVFAKFRDRDRDVARRFYKKYLDINGVPVLASADVADEALQRTHEIVTHLLAGRPDVLEAMAKFGTRLIIIGKDQVYTDMPEYRNSPNPEYQNERVRGTGGLRVTSFGEENLLNLAGDRYDDESIGRPRVLPHDRRRAGADRPHLAQPAGHDLPERGRRRACGRTPTPAPTRPNTGPRSASRTSTATGSTTGITTPSARASN